MVSTQSQRIPSKSTIFTAEANAIDMGINDIERSDNNCSVNFVENKAKNHPNLSIKCAKRGLEVKEISKNQQDHQSARKDVQN